MLSNEIIYQIFVRNFSDEGTFQKVKEDLPRIKELGADIVYLMPIHPIGELNRKGTYGSPYSISNYFAITEDYGTLEDFISLIDSVHELGMKLIIDMVFNHTSYDNVLVANHPEYYFYRDGKMGNRVGEWSDIADLDTSRYGTKEYMLSVLKYWVKQGVDGFRFDVASMIPLDFFIMAREELGPDIIFIGESIDPGFASYLRSIDDAPTPDKDMFPTFDSLYNYSWFRSFISYINGESTIDKFVKDFNEDNESLKNKGIRLNCLENHDNERIANLVSSEKLQQLLDLFAHLKGQLFIYAGQEYGNKHKPELFEKDPIIWKKDEKTLSLYKKAIKTKKKLPPIDYQSLEKIGEHKIRLISYKDEKVVDTREFEI